MSRIISRAESWEKAYEAFQNVNFSAFDYATIKESMVEYIKLYFPENFNDYIESSEFIALLELFAYLGEVISYRLDLNAHENFLTTAQRKESILRLAKLISYDPTRNIPARGLVKLTSITTTEQIFDSNGINLSGQTIIWNDINNPNWKEQFLLVMNDILKQEFGSVSPNERVQVDDVLFELYEWNNNPIQDGVFRFSANVSGENIPFELVPATLDDLGPHERRPDTETPFSILYGADGLGDASDTTGFFMFAKQGTLTSQITTFDGVTPNQTYDINIDNINETDVWVNNIDPITGNVIDDGTGVGGRSGEWEEVDLAHAQNIVFNTNPVRTKYEVETLDKDQIRLIFGDGEFADLPSGTFRVWYRTSLNRDIVIPQNTIVNQSGTFTYQNEDNNVQTISFTYSAIGSFQNASASEELEHIRTTAPAVYYTQDRMVNNRDYNTFFLQDPTILKLRSINRTFAGDSKYMAWHDGSESYENVKLFGDDLVLYFKESTHDESVLNESRVNVIITNHIEPLLSSTDLFTILSSRGMDPAQIRRVFSEAERLVINDALVDATVAPPSVVNLYFSIVEDEWTIAADYSDSVELITIIAHTNSSWTITHKTERLIAESQATKFWNTNDADTVIDYDTLNSARDKIIVLSANRDKSRTNVLEQNQQFDILGHERIELGLPSAGLTDIHKLSVLPEDTNDDAVADDMELTNILNPEFTVNNLADVLLPDLPLTIEVPFTFLNNVGSLVSGNDLEVDASGAITYEVRLDGAIAAAGQPANEIVVTAINTNVTATFTVADYVYFKRETVFDDYIPQSHTLENIQDYLVESNWKRERGRSNLNFMWHHTSPRFHLIDPAATNIIDMFIISKGHFTSVRKWLDDRTSLEPTPPTPLNLRTDYAHMIDNKMISDTIVLHPGKIKILFGKHAIPSLQASFRIVRSPTGILTDNQIKVQVIDTITSFFDINLWEFGETFYFTELSAAIHAALPSEIDSVVLVPTLDTDQFGDLFQIFAREDEILQPSISVENIEIVQSLTPQIIRQTS